MQRRAQEDGEARPPAAQEGEVRFPGPRPMRLLEWKVSTGTSVQIGSVLALGLNIPTAESREKRGPQEEAAVGRPHRPPERKVKSDRAGVVLELCVRPGQVVCAGGVLVRLSGCNHPVVMKGLCAECGQDLTQLQNKNGKQQVPLSTATVSMVHSVPELMVSSEQAEQLGREDQHRLHRNRKLVLMVDLDQTLIHTTEQHFQHMSRRGIFHFQLGRGEPMLHTRLRPHCKDFLEKIAKLYELHVFTFGSRLYAHTIAGYLDSEKKLFSHRILSRDECIDPFSKTGNLSNLFPCGDSMVCIIDDREDVWKFAPNLITVKKYVYFQGTGDINAPPGSREAQIKNRVSGPKSSAVQPSEPTTQFSGQSKDIPVEEQSNGLGKTSKELNGDPPSSNLKPESDASDGLQEQDSLSSQHTDIISDVKDSTQPTEVKPPLDQDERTVVSKSLVKTGAAKDLDFDLSSDSDSETENRKTPSPPSPGSENECKKNKKSEHLDQESGVLQESSTQDLPEKPCTENHNSGEKLTLEAKDKLLTGEDNIEVQGVDQDGLCDLGNGCTDKKEIETESQNSEQSGITVGESLDQSMEEDDDDGDDVDEDDHLIYLEEILVRVHTDYYAKYDRFLKKELDETPDIRKIVPELKSKVLENTMIAFSGLHPTNFPIERTREYYHARALGSKISKQLVLNDDGPNRVTHLIAARAGTEKVKQAQNCKHLYVVNPDWLWSCLERWEKVEEQLFPLKEDYLKSQRALSPSTFPDIHTAFQTPLYHPTPIHPITRPGPEVRQYDPVTGKLIRKVSQDSSQSPYIQSPCPSLGLAVHGEHSSFRVVQPSQEQLFDDEELPTASAEEEQSGPARRKRQPSMSESMPLYTLCKEDLESMDKEVDDILGEGSDDSDSEKKKSVKVKKSQNTKQESSEKTSGTRAESSSSSEQSLSDQTPRGHKRKLDVDEEDAEDDRASESSNEEGSSSEADEMAAAIEAELNDFI
ncbi:RNA polymerase II subunit A C-terminal domain phosphatase isoform X1 [Rana temporaria]|uniref:RNA polymerase II subunit A C-terminal domain phosphatase isoform X1 n=1 Tax=Rana temporaria TaxID=8407 RepID=UPI001AAD4233|nr:RNA polymerase II subunit A C-terminal domain phosphatase isoform X1 [Rana temporaria]